jgi:hypothetical protein
MRRFLIALTACALLLLAVGVGAAWADPPPGKDQTGGQVASGDQKAGTDAGSAQEQPSNRNISVRVLSPGDNGSVEQSNTSAAAAVSANKNKTEQDIDQKQGSGSCRDKCGSSGDASQTAGQAAESNQDASS